MYTIAVDIGGTFTDVIAIDNRNGDTAMGKALTTPGDLQQGVLNGLADAAANLSTSVPALLGQTERMVHATTQSSNAVFAFTASRVIRDPALSMRSMASLWSPVKWMFARAAGDMRSHRLPSTTGSVRTNVTKRTRRGERSAR